MKKGNRRASIKRPYRRGQRKPRILFYDLETEPNLGYTWGKYDQNVLRFTKVGGILSVAYRWRGQKNSHFLSREGQKDDRQIAKRLHTLFRKADLIVAHNGDSFDTLIARTRMLKHGLPPPTIVSSVDTKKVAKKYFRFTGNSLDDLARFLGFGSKLPTPGFSLWEGCLADDPKSWREMERYNRHDVVLLEKVYERLLPWIQDHPTLARAVNPDLRRIGVCPYCSSTNVERRGYRATQARVLQRWECQENDCGGWFQTRRLKQGDMVGLRRKS